MITKKINDGLYSENHLNGQLKLNGFYKNKLREEKWTYWYDDGQKFAEGFFKNGRRDGQWIYWHENGQKSARGGFTSRPYHYGMKYEKGVDNYGAQNQVLWNGKKEEQKDGLWTYWYANGLKAAEGKYGGPEAMKGGNLIKEDAIIGKKEYYGGWGPERLFGHQKYNSWTYWHANGSKAREEYWTYVHQGRKSNMAFHERGIELPQLAGRVVCWYNNGQKSLEAAYTEDGLMDGPWIEYYPDGHIKFNAHYSDDELLSIQMWSDTREYLWAHFRNGKRSDIWRINYPSGNPKLKITYSEPHSRTSLYNFESIFHGKQISFYPSGQKEIEMNFTLGKKDGIVTTWHENGQVESEGIFINGELDGDVKKWNLSGERSLESCTDYWKINLDNLDNLDGFLRSKKIFIHPTIEKIANSERYLSYASVYNIESESGDSLTSFELK